MLGLSASAVLLTSSSSFSLGIARAGHGTALTRASVRLSARHSRLPPLRGSRSASPRRLPPVFMVSSVEPSLSHPFDKLRVNYPLLFDNSSLDLARDKSFSLFISPRMSASFFALLYSIHEAVVLSLTIVFVLTVSSLLTLGNNQASLLLLSLTRSLLQCKPALPVGEPL